MSVPQSAIDLLKLREGFKSKPYEDSVGKWTCGYGHLMLPSEIAQYGTQHEIDQTVLEGWLAYDSQAAYEAAVKQSHVLGVASPHFTDVLTSVNYQLGVGWIREFNGTWALLKAHKWEEAAKHLETLPWYRETPTRVKDFQQAIRSLIKL